MYSIHPELAAAACGELCQNCSSRLKAPTKCLVDRGVIWSVSILLVQDVLTGGLAAASMSVQGALRGVSHATHSLHSRLAGIRRSAVREAQTAARGSERLVRPSGGSGDSCTSVTAGRTNGTAMTESAALPVLKSVVDGASGAQNGTFFNGSVEVKDGDWAAHDNAGPEGVNIALGDEDSWKAGDCAEMAAAVKSGRLKLESHGVVHGSNAKHGFAQTNCAQIADVRRNGISATDLQTLSSDVRDGVRVIISAVRETGEVRSGDVDWKVGEHAVVRLQIGSQRTGSVGDSRPGSRHVQSDQASGLQEGARHKSFERKCEPVCHIQELSTGSPTSAVAGGGKCGTSADKMVEVIGPDSSENLGRGGEHIQENHLSGAPKMETKLGRSWIGAGVSTSPDKLGALPAEALREQESAKEDRCPDPLEEKPHAYHNSSSSSSSRRRRRNSPEACRRRGGASGRSGASSPVVTRAGSQRDSITTDLIFQDISKRNREPRGSKAVADEQTGIADVTLSARRSESSQLCDGSEHLLSVSILGSRIAPWPGKPHAVYCVAVVANGGRQSIVWRRFSQVRELQKNLEGASGVMGTFFGHPQGTLSSMNALKAIRG
jgi:hypothetical protein